MPTPDATVVIDADTGVAAPAAPATAALPPLLQMLMASSGGLGGLAGQGGGPGLDGSGLLSTLLAAQSGGGGDNGNTLATLLQLMQATRAAPSPPAPVEEAEPAASPAQEAEGDGPAAADVQALVVHARAMEQEIELLHQRNDSLAAALGACYLCFGQDGACPVCRGRGVPGRRPPQPGHFRFWVQPVLDRWMPAFAAAAAPPLRHQPPASLAARPAWPQAAPAPAASAARMSDYLSATWPGPGGYPSNYTQ